MVLNVEWALIGVLCLMAAAGARGQVVLREGKGELRGTVVEVGVGGVTVDAEENGQNSKRVVGWDRVLRVEGEHAGEAAAMLGAAEELWRVRVRVERGDWPGAESLLAGLWPSIRDQSGPSAVVGLDAALRCRLARGARAGAIGAWLELMGAYERSGAVSSGVGAAVVVRPSAWVGGVIGGLPALDLRTGLTPSLPPMWVGEPSMAAAAAAGEWMHAPLSAKASLVSELAGWYGVAARDEAGGDGARMEWPAGTGGSAGVRLVRLIVQARVGDAAARAGARELLRGIMGSESIEPWEEAWCRAGIGRSLLGETENEQKIAGVIELLHVPARLSGASPYLAGVCLAEAAVAMWDVGDKQAAAALKGELLARHPGHPAASWGRMAEIVSPVVVAAPVVAVEAKDLPVVPRVERGRR